MIYAEGNTAVNRSAVADFCQEHCSEYLQYWFHKLARDCGNPIGVSQVYNLCDTCALCVCIIHVQNDVAVRLLNQTCYKGPHDLYCAFLWGYFRDTTLLPSSIQVGFCGHCSHYVVINTKCCWLPAMYDGYDKRWR